MATVGRGSSLIINVPPNTAGVVPAPYVEAVAALGQAVAASFSGPSVVEANGVTGGCQGYESPSGVIAELTLPPGAMFDAVVSEEDVIVTGQHIQSFVILFYSHMIDCERSEWEIMTIQISDLHLPQ